MRSLWLCIVASLLVACGGRTALAELAPKEACWKISNRIEVNISHPGGTLDLPVELALTAEYPFSNLYLKATLKSGIGVDTSWTMTKTFVDPLGNWLVAEKAGSYRVNYDILRKQDFPAGDYTISLGHNMRPERVCGVEVVRLLAPPQK